MKKRGFTLFEELGEMRISQRFPKSRSA